MSTYTSPEAAPRSTQESPGSTALIERAANLYAIVNGEENGTQSHLEERNDISPSTRAAKLRNGLGIAAAYIDFGMNVAASRMMQSADEKEKRLQQNLQRHEVQEGDSFPARLKKALGRRAVKAAAWTMTGLTAAAAASPLLRPFIDLPHGQPLHMDIKDIADVTVLIGGNGDPTSKGLEQQLSGTGLVTGEVRRVNYAANVFGSNESNKAGIAQVVGIVNENAQKGKTTDVVGYSLGSQVSHGAIEQLQTQNKGGTPKGTRFVMLGAPSQPRDQYGQGGGALNNPLIGFGGNIIGTSLNTPAKGADNMVYVANRSGDFWTNPNLGNLGATTTGDGHSYTQNKIKDAPVTKVGNINGSSTLIIENDAAPVKTTGKSQLLQQLDAVKTSDGKLPAPTANAANTAQTGWNQHTTAKPGGVTNLAQKPLPRQFESINAPAPARQAPQIVHPNIPKPPINQQAANQDFLRQIHAQRSGSARR